MDMVWFLLIGLAAGWLASQVMKGGSSSLVTDLIMGVIGSILSQHDAHSGDGGTCRRAQGRDRSLICSRVTRA